MSDVRAHVVRLVVAVESSLTKAWEGTLRRPDREALPDQNLQLLSLRFRGLLLPGRTDQGIRNARLSARRGSRPLTSSVNGRRCWCRLRINNGAGRRWRHNCRSGRRLDYPLLLNATRSQGGNADGGGNKGKTFHGGAPCRIVLATTTRTYRGCTEMVTSMIWRARFGTSSDIAGLRRSFPPTHKSG